MAGTTSLAPFSRNTLLSSLLDHDIPDDTSEEHDSNTEHEGENARRSDTACAAGRRGRSGGGAAAGAGAGRARLRARCAGRVAAAGHRCGRAGRRRRRGGTTVERGRGEGLAVGGRGHTRLVRRGIGKRIGLVPGRG